MIRIPLLNSPRILRVDSEGARDWYDHEHANRRANDAYYRLLDGPDRCYCGSKKPVRETACAKCRKSQEAS